MSVYTVHPTTFEVLKDGTPLVGSPFSNSTESLQSAIDDSVVGDTIVPLAGVHKLNASLSPTDTLTILTIFDEYDYYDSATQYSGGIRPGYKVLSLYKGITIEGETDTNGNLLTTIEGGVSDADFSPFRGLGYGDFSQTSFSGLVVHNGQRDGSNRPILSKLKMRNFEWFGVDLVAPAYIQDCEFEYIGNVFNWGIAPHYIYPHFELFLPDYTDSHPWNITNNSIHHVCEIGHGTWVSELTFENNKLQGYVVDPSMPPDLLAAGTECFGGMFLWGLNTVSRNNTVRGNLFSGKYPNGNQGANPFWAALRLEGGAVDGVSENNVITVNTFEDFPGDCLVIEVTAAYNGRSRNNEISGNTFTRVPKSIMGSVISAAEHSGLQITGNTFSYADQSTYTAELFAILLIETDLIAPIDSWQILENDYTLGGYTKKNSQNTCAGQIYDAVNGYIFEPPSRFPRGGNLMNSFFMTPLTVKTSNIQPGNHSGQPGKPKPVVLSVRDAVYNYVTGQGRMKVKK